MMAISLELVIGSLVTLGGVVWRVSEVRRQIEREFDRDLDNITESLLENEAKLTLLAQKFESETRELDTRITTLHLNSKSKIKDLIDQQNQLIHYMTKCLKEGKCDHDFIIRTRQMSKETFSGDDDDSWTQFQIKK